MTKRVSPMERIRAQIDDLFAASDRPLTEILEDVGRLSVRLLMQTAVEAEVEEFLSRAAMTAGTRTARPVIATAISRRRR